MPVVIQDVVWGAIVRTISAHCPRPSQESAAYAPAANLALSAGSAGVAGSAGTFDSVVSVASASSGESATYADVVSSAWPHGLGGSCIWVHWPTSGAQSAGAAGYAESALQSSGACPLAVEASRAMSAGAVLSAIAVHNVGSASNVPYAIFASKAASADMAGLASIVYNSGAVSRVPYAVEAHHVSSAGAVEYANYVSNSGGANRVPWTPEARSGGTATLVTSARYLSNTSTRAISSAPSCRTARSAAYVMSCSKAGVIDQTFAGIAGAADTAGTLAGAALSSLAVLVSSGGIAMPAGGEQECYGVKTFCDGIIAPPPAGESMACTVAVVRSLVSAALAGREIL